MYESGNRFNNKIINKYFNLLPNIFIHLESMLLLVVLISKCSKLFKIELFNRFKIHFFS